MMWINIKHIMFTHTIRSTCELYISRMKPRSNDKKKKITFNSLNDITSAFFKQDLNDTNDKEKSSRHVDGVTSSSIAPTSTVSYVSAASTSNNPSSFIKVMSYEERKLKEVVTIVPFIFMYILFC